MTCSFYGRSRGTATSDWRDGFTVGHVVQRLLIGGMGLRSVTWYSDFWLAGWVHGRSRGTATSDWRDGFTVGHVVQRLLIGGMGIRSVTWYSDFSLAGWVYTYRLRGIGKIIIIIKKRQKQKQNNKP